MKKSFALILLIVTFIAACKKEDKSELITPKTSEDQTFSPTPYILELPSHFSLINPPEIPEFNPLTEEGVELGRRLYYEKKLSKDGPLDGKSCSSCHHQELSFTIPAVIQPYGNVCAHFNLAWNKRFFWQGMLSGTLEDAMRFEVHDFFKSDLSGIKNDPDYKKRFKAAFNTDTIKLKEVTYALAQFMRTMITGNSRFDNFIKIFYSNEAPTGPALNAQERRGLDLYMTEGKGDCFHCHGDLTNPLLTNFAMVNNGLDVNPDSGYAIATKNPMDIGKFMTPSLRNLVFTGPYMHDGRFNSLEEVVDFYADDVQENSPNIDPLMLLPRILNTSERADLVAFLKSITDSSYIKNPAFSKPADM